jgi:predicted phage terminase large subunit-like protein
MLKTGNRANGAYAVGFARPPKATRFPPGQSGNPRGRPKGARNRTSMAREALERIITVKKNGRRHRMTVREAAFLRLAEKAGAGDLKSIHYLLALERNEHSPGSEQLDFHNSFERALEKVQFFLERRRASLSGVNNEKTEMLGKKLIKSHSNLVRPENDEIMRALILSRRQDFLTFASACYELLAGKPLPRLVYIEAMADEIDLVLRGSRRRLMINGPPRCFKSFLASVCGPAYVLGLDPRKRIMVASNNLDLAADLSKASRRILTSDFFRAVFPMTGISRDAELEVATTAGGYRLAVSMEGAVGRGADILICDDSIKPSDAQPQRMRDSCHENFCSALVPRLNDQTNDKIVVVGQRLHHDDLCGRLLKNEPQNWPLLRLAAIAEADEKIGIGDGDRHVYLRRAGELLDPERLPKSRLDELRSSLGEEIFAAQFQQRPVRPEGAIIRPEQVKRCDRLPARTSSSYVIQSWDTALKSGGRHDYSVCVTLLVHDQSYYLADVLRGRFDPSELVQHAQSRAQTYRPNHIVIEDCFGIGSALVNHLQVAGYVATAVKPETDKRSRFWAQSLKIAHGRLVVPNGLSWVAGFLDELFGFPDVAHDDQVDALSQALAYADERVNAILWTDESLKGFFVQALCFPF